jgi:hypothetical protein
MDAFYQTWFAVRHVHVPSTPLLVDSAGQI